MKAIIFRKNTEIRRIGIAPDFINQKSLELKSVKGNKTKTPEELEILAIEFLASQVVPSGAEWKIFDTDDEPADKLYDDSWGYDLKEDIIKLRKIKKRFLRAEREAFFTANVRVLRDAMIDNDSGKLQAGRTERDRLRNITDLVDSAGTIAEIKAIAV